MIDNIISQLKRDEGVRLKPYKDSVGKLTIGVGRNLDDVGISTEEADYLLQNDLIVTEARLSSTFPWTQGLDPVRRAVLVNMAFNMGVGGLAQFRHMLEAAQAGDYTKAAEEMNNSTWASQVGARAMRLAIQMESGTWQ